MSVRERKEQILNLLEQDGFLTVKRLSQLTFISESSIRRDLCDLQKQGRIHRTHGGAVPADAVERLPSLSNRMTKNTAGKRKLAKKAATLLRDGMIIMLDGSSTASFMVPYLAKHKDITLFTNNMTTALRAIELGIDTHCIGGHSVNRSAALSGEGAYAAVAELHPDVLFFSSQCLDRNGLITDLNAEENHLRKLMIKSAKQSVFLCDSEKFDTTALYTLTTLDQVDYAVFDEDYVMLKVNFQNIL